MKHFYRSGFEHEPRNCPASTLTTLLIHTDQGVISVSTYNYLHSKIHIAFHNKIKILRL